MRRFSRRSDGRHYEDIPHETPTAYGISITLWDIIITIATACAICAYAVS